MICKKCGKDLPFSDFYKSNKSKCKKCFKEYQSVYIKKKPSVQKNANEKWRNKNKDKLKNWFKKYRKYRNIYQQLLTAKKQLYEFEHKKQVLILKIKHLEESVSNIRREQNIGSK